jgi:hypothetical protein
MTGVTPSSLEAGQFPWTYTAAYAPAYSYYGPVTYSAYYGFYGSGWGLGYWTGYAPYSAGCGYLTTGCGWWGCGYRAADVGRCGVSSCCYTAPSCCSPCGVNSCGLASVCGDWCATSAGGCATGDCGIVTPATSAPTPDRSVPAGTTTNPGDYAPEKESEQKTFELPVRREQAPATDVLPRSEPRQPPAGDPGNLFEPSGEQESFKIPLPDDPANAEPTDPSDIPEGEKLDRSDEASPTEQVDVRPLDLTSGVAATAAASRTRQSFRLVYRAPIVARTTVTPATQGWTPIPGGTQVAHSE